MNSICLQRLAQNNTATAFTFLEALSFEPLGVLLYGSVVRGEQVSSSDVDWLIVAPTEVKVDRKVYNQVDALELPDRKIFLSVAHLPSSPDHASNYWLELALEAEILLDRTGEIRKCLLGIRYEIANGAFQRYLTHGQPYWVRRKPLAQPKTS